jgi:hypothetical protein
MRGKWTSALLALFLAGILPGLYIRLLRPETQLEAAQTAPITFETTLATQPDAYTLPVKTAQGVVNMELEQYIVCVVLREMPAYFENEALKARIQQMEEQRFAQLAKQYENAGDVLLFEDGLAPDGVRRLCVAVAEVCGGRCVCCSGEDGAGYKYAMCHKGGNMKDLTKTLNQTLNGRGGGKPDFVQGSVSASRADIEAFFANL